MKRFIKPCLLAAAVFGHAAHASSLVPPPGYYAPVPAQKKGRADTCPAVPAPYTGSLVFRSKYEGSDKARATLNQASEQAFREQTTSITALEKGLSNLVMHYLRDGQPQQLECAMQWLSRWAEADALRSEDYNHTGKSVRKWALGSMAAAYLRLKFSESRPLQAYPQQTQSIEAWFGKLADQVVRDWSGLPLKKINNHSYWAAWSVMASAVATDRRDLFDWAVQQFEVAAQQVDPDGYLPNELKREQRALAYHNYSLPPLAMVAAFAQSNGVDLRGSNHGALQRLAQRVITGVDDAEAFAERAERKQDMSELEKDSKFSWLEPYCSIYPCDSKVLEWRASMQPFKTFRLGGDVTQLFQGQQAHSSTDQGPTSKSPEQTKKKFWLW